MTTQIADLVGLTEIAERCDVTKNVASGWTRKHTFPAIKHKLAMGPMWDWKEVQEHLYGQQKLKIELYGGGLFAYVKATPCMMCDSTDLTILPGSVLNGHWVEFTYYCNACQCSVERAVDVDLSKEEE